MNAEIANALPEMAELEQLIKEYASLLSVRSLCDVDAHGHRFPVYLLALGDNSPEKPAIGFFGGVHGLERIGTQVLLAFLRSLLARLRWDAVLQHQLASVRLIFMPLVNPAGMWRKTRCNPHGVDLMRNAPVQSEEKVLFMIGGHRFSRRLPWYRGLPDLPMEPESQAVCQAVQEELLSHEFSLALDCHSGFGLRDRIWFPYAYTKSPIPHLPEVFMLQHLFGNTYPNHFYLFEPQSRQYLTHGDLWDYLYMQASCNASRIFLPLTLELGSWVWVKKSPLQLFSRNGLFNPLPAHRLQRVLRRHLIWLEFLISAVSNYRHWLPQGALRLEQQQQAMALWYGKAGA